MSPSLLLTSRIPRSPPPPPHPRWSSPPLVSFPARRTRLVGLRLARAAADAHEPNGASPGSGGEGDAKPANGTGTNLPNNRRDILLEYVKNVQPEFMELFIKRAPAQVVDAMRQTVTNMIGTLPPQFFAVTVTTVAENLAQLMYSVLMTGYMFRNAQYRLELQQSLEQIALPEPKEEKDSPDYAPGTQKKVTGEVIRWNKATGPEKIDAVKYIELLEAEIDELRRQVARKPSQGSNELLKYLKTLEPQNLKELASSAGEDVVFAMNAFIKRLLVVSDPAQMKAVLPCLLRSEENLSPTRRGLYSFLPSTPLPLHAPIPSHVSHKTKKKRKKTRQRGIPTETLGEREERREIGEKLNPMAPPPPPSPSPPASGAQYAHQFLNTALSQRGPSALPYAEDVKWLIRNHLVALADAFPSLHPKAALFTHNDGRAAHLLQADGTLPILHAGASYNLPAVIWLPEPYPRSPPLVFLSPTRDMLIKPHHPLVDRSGLVANAPYLRSWVFPSSNLVDLVRSLSHLFGLDPPLFTRSPNPPPPAIVTPSSVAPVTPAPPPRSYRFPASPQLAAHPPPTEDPAEVYRRNAVAKLVDLAYADAAALRTAREAEVDSLFAVQAELRSRGEVVADGVRKMGEEKEALERRLQDVMMATDVMEAWVMDNRKGAAVDTEAEETMEPADVLSRQMLECTAADLALEDTIYALDKAVQEGSVPFDGYLRSVRALAREQFFQRVLCTKVNSAQQQAQVARMATRGAPPQYAS